MSTSSFKFLDAYMRQDASLFFGRDKEAEELYDLTFDTRLLVVVGASGTGKTSLVRCGLSNKFPSSRWNEVLIRREKNINESLLKALDEKIDTLKSNEGKSRQTPIEKIAWINYQSFKPTYLIFDQLEELFIVKSDESEQLIFIEFLDKLLNTQIACKVILIMRYEFISDLWKYESIIPTLFDHKYRVEKMRPAIMMEVIASTLAVMDDRDVVASQNREEIAKAIVGNLSEEKSLELTYLQVYLEKLYLEAKMKDPDLPVITPQLVAEAGKFEDVISDFISTQLDEIESRLLSDRKGVPLQILAAMITDRKTKKILSAEELESIRSELNISKKDFDLCIEAFDNMKILKRYYS